MVMKPVCPLCKNEAVEVQNIGWDCYCGKCVAYFHIDTNVESGEGDS